MIYDYSGQNPALYTKTDSLVSGPAVYEVRKNDNTKPTLYYIDANGSPDTTIDINSEAGCNVRGLEPGEYYLEEVVVPGGYNKLAAREKVTVTTGQTATVEVIVVNEAGAQLPSTGGIGTTIFYIAGAVLVLGAGAIVIARRKAEQD